MELTLIIIALVISAVATAFFMYVKKSLIWLQIVLSTIGFLSMYIFYKRIDSPSVNVSLAIMTAACIIGVVMLEKHKKNK